MNDNCDWLLVTPKCMHSSEWRCIAADDDDGVAGIALGLGLQPTYFEGERAGQAQSYWCTRVIHYPPLAEGTSHRSAPHLPNNRRSVKTLCIRCFWHLTPNPANFAAGKRLYICSSFQLQLQADGVQTAKNSACTVSSAVLPAILLILTQDFVHGGSLAPWTQAN